MKKFSYFSHAVILGVTLGAGVLTSCTDPYYVNKGPRYSLGESAETEETLNLSGVDGEIVSGEYRCPGEENVIPDYDYFFDGTGQFKVCRSMKSKNRFKVFGMTHFSDTICVFPVAIRSQALPNGDDNGFSEIPEIYRSTENGNVLHKCIKVASSGVVFEFKGIQVDAAFIVENPFRAQMQTCLGDPLGPNYNACPGNPGYFSYGSF